MPIIEDHMHNICKLHDNMLNACKTDHIHATGMSQMRITYILKSDIKKNKCELLHYE